jgi:hypothetical protein
MTGDIGAITAEQSRQRTCPVNPPTKVRAELLEWRDACASKPDPDLLQLIWWCDSDGNCDWDAAWWTGEEWLLAESGGLVPGTVLFYARPEGPEGC